MAHPALRAAVVGAGPSGFYSCEELLRAGFQVDLLDALPTPYGLVRAGVAPDHPKIKSVTRVFDRTAARPGFRFLGGVEFGTDVVRAELLERYDVVIYAVGTKTDTRLRIPGEDLPGSHPATQFVAWYNGHPEHATRDFPLQVDSAVVVGNGNVALDVARMLVLDPATLGRTDVADHALDSLAVATVGRVTVLGRRGPVQAAFSTAELRELGALDGVDVTVDPADLELDDASAAELAATGPGSAEQRRLELLREFATRRPTDGNRRIDLRFRQSPVEVVSDPAAARVAGLRVVHNRLAVGPGGRTVAVATGRTTLHGCQLVVRAVGYRGQALPDVPFDEDRGLIRNAEGRVLDDEGRPLPGEYAVGWIKRGPSGVIGTNKACAADTVARVLEDVAAGRLDGTPRSGPDLTELLRDRVPGLVDWAGWQAIDDHERGRGEPAGRPRVKLVAVGELLEAARVRR